LDSRETRAVDGADLAKSQSHAVEMSQEERVVPPAREYSLCAQRVGYVSVGALDSENR